MGTKGSSAMMVPPQDPRSAIAQGRRRQRRVRGVATVPQTKGRENEEAADLAILNRNARRLNREARDVLGFQGAV